MNNYSRKFARHEQSVPQNYTTEVHMPDGTSVLKVVGEKPESPFKGIDSESFTLSSQIKAGVKMTPQSPLKLGGSIGSIDSVTNVVTNLIDE